MEQRVVSKVIWRLVPFMMVLYVFNYLDRINISVAKLQLFDDLKFDDGIYGWGTALFFPAYFLFEVPSNMMMEKYGARVWIARIMISWGIISAAFVFLQGPWSFYVLRFLLGAAEAGFFPGMLLYLTYWIPAKHRANVGAIFMTSIALSGVIGNPLSGYIIEHMRDVWGMRGWQWLFLLESIPTILLGFTVYSFLTDKPEVAEWLAPEEREWLSKHLQDERAITKGNHNNHSLADAFKSGRVWLLSFIYLSLMMGFYGINYWTPTIVKKLLTNEYAAAAKATETIAAKVSDGYVGQLSAIPFIAAIIGMLIIGRIADWTGNRKATLVCTSLIGCAGLVAASQTTTLSTTLIAMSVAAIGIFGSLAPFWTLPSSFLTGTAAAAGIAFINSLGNLGGGFVGNALKGYLMNTYGTHTYGMMVDAGVLFIGVILVLFVHVTPQKSEADLTHD
ncbi:MAG: MFS transporter [Planctomycetota bacterium]